MIKGFLENRILNTLKGGGHLIDIIESIFNEAEYAESTFLIGLSTWLNKTL